VAATKFEFEWRFWIITTIFGLAFTLHAIDHRGVAELILRTISSTVPTGSPRGVAIQQGILFAGAVLVFLAALFRTWATAYLGADVMKDRTLHSDMLAVDGPYRHTRNPLYFADLPLALGVGIFSNPTGLVFLCAAMFVFVYRLIFREEAILRRTLGQAYIAYANKVPRFWPSLRARCPASGRTPSWGQAILGELLLWLIGITLVVFALTLNQTLLLCGFALSFAVAIGLHSVTGKRAGTVRDHGV